MATTTTSSSTAPLPQILLEVATNNISSPLALCPPRKNYFCCVVLLLCCVVLCCVVLRCVVLRCVVLCCVVFVVERRRGGLMTHRTLQLVSGNSLQEDRGLYCGSSNIPRIRSHGSIVRWVRELCHTHSHPTGPAGENRVSG